MTPLRGKDGRIKRKKLPDKKLAELMLAQGWRCAICAGEIGVGGVPFNRDHHNRLANGGADDAENIRLLCIPCHAVKTAQDMGAEAKIRRLTGTNKPRPKRKIGGRYRKKMDGTVERVIGDD